MTNETVAAEWCERLDDFCRSGLSVDRWCAAHDVSSHRFYYWRRKLSRSGTSRDKQGVVDWLSVPVGGAAHAPVSLSVRVGAACIDVAPGFDAALLRAVVAALEPARC